MNELHPGTGTDRHRKAKNRSVLW